VNERTALEASYSQNVLLQRPRAFRQGFICEKSLLYVMNLAILIVEFVEFI